MPLPESTVARERLHVRRVTYEGWRRDDGLFDIEARLVDTKDHDYTLASGLRPAGEPIHEMVARVTIGRDCVIRALVATSDRVPYHDGCELIAPDYAKLVGCNLLHDFRRTLYERLGGVHGCSHLTELIAFLPTAAMQTFAGLVRDADPAAVHKPYQLDRCHALEHTSETVRRYYPKWYRDPSGVAPTAIAPLASAAAKRDPQTPSDAAGTPPTRGGTQ
jgi:hypothetical protein